MRGEGFDELLNNIKYSVSGKKRLKRYFAMEFVGDSVIESLEKERRY